MVAINWASKTNFQSNIGHYFAVWSLHKKPVSCHFEPENLEGAEEFFHKKTGERPGVYLSS